MSRVNSNVRSPQAMVELQRRPRRRNVSGEAVLEHNFPLAKAAAAKAFEQPYLEALLQQHAGNGTRTPMPPARNDRFRRLLRQQKLCPTTERWSENR